MPTKQFLMDNYDSASAILAYAVSSHSTASMLDFVKYIGGVCHIRCHEEGNPGNTYEGSGASKKEAMADCISTEFPG